MVDYRSCIVPDIKLRKKVYVWVAYSPKPPYLPVEIASTADELAQKCGVAYSTIMSSWWRYQKGKANRSRFHKVKVGYDLAWEGADG